MVSLLASYYKRLWSLLTLTHAEGRHAVMGHQCVGLIPGTSGKHVIMYLIAQTVHMDGRPLGAQMAFWDWNQHLEVWNTIINAVAVYRVT